MLTAPTPTSYNNPTSYTLAPTPTTYVSDHSSLTLAPTPTSYVEDHSEYTFAPTPTVGDPNSLTYPPTPTSFIPPTQSPTYWYASRAWWNVNEAGTISIIVFSGVFLVGMLLLISYWTAKPPAGSKPPASAAPHYDVAPAPPAQAGDMESAPLLPPAPGPSS